MVIVDAAIYKFGRMLMCHMVADTHEELLQMATALGVDHKWIQNPGTPREHFDICKSKRKKAIALGAVEVSAREMGRRLREKREATSGKTTVITLDLSEEDAAAIEAKFKSGELQSLASLKVLSVERVEE